MKPATFYIVLSVYYLSAAQMLDFISGEGLLHGAVFMLISLAVTAGILWVIRKKRGSAEDFRALCRRFVPPVLGIALIVLFALRTGLLLLLHYYM